MRAHMQDEIMLMLAFLMAHRTLELRLHAALEPNVPIEAVRPSVRVSTPNTRVGPSRGSLVRSTRSKDA